MNTKKPLNGKSPAGNRRISKALIVEKLMFSLIRLSSFAIIVFLVLLVGYIFKQGWSAISWEFITEMPRDEMTRGGIFPAIAGTFYLMIGSSVISIPIGIITAIYLTEYAKNRRVIRVIRLGINNLAGVPIERTPRIIISHPTVTAFRVTL